jgi:predicted ATPase
VITGGRRSGRHRKALSGPLLVEVMGPAGTGKTTLLRALCSQDESIRAGLDLKKARYIRPSLRKLGVFLPVWALHHRDDRWLDRRDMRSIARLETWSQALERPTTGRGSAAVFDHGPLYRLARLREFGPELTESEPFERWWRGSLTWWLEALDIVVMLEAPDAVLLQRIDERGHWFLGGDHPREEKDEFLARYRRSFAEILAQVPEGKGERPMVLRFRTDEMPVGTIATEVLSVIASMRSTSDPRERSR